MRNNESCSGKDIFSKGGSTFYGSGTFDEADRVHRCTIYAYIRYLEKPLAFLKIPDKAKRVFRGTDLIAYKETGLPKRGRKRKKHR